MANLGIDVWPTFWGFMAAATEGVGGLLLIIGIFYRPICLLLTFTMIVAASTHFKAGDKFMEKTSRPIELAFVFIGLAFAGPDDSPSTKIDQKNRLRVGASNLPFLFLIAGWSSLVARQAHNLKVVGSNPTPATTLKPSLAQALEGFLFSGCCGSADDDFDRFCPFLPFCACVGRVWRVASAAVKVRKIKYRSGRSAWQLDYGMVTQPDGSRKRVQKYFETREAAMGALGSEKMKRQRHGDSAISLSEEDRVRFTAAQRQLAAVGATIEQAVALFLRQSRAVREPMALGDLFRECLADKATEVIRARVDPTLKELIRAAADRLALDEAMSSAWAPSNTPCRCSHLHPCCPMASEDKQKEVPSAHASANYFSGGSIASSSPAAMAPNPRSCAMPSNNISSLKKSASASVTHSFMATFPSPGKLSSRAAAHASQKRTHLIVQPRTQRRIPSRLRDSKIDTHRALIEGRLMKTLLAVGIVLLVIVWIRSGREERARQAAADRQRAMGMVAEMQELEQTARLNEELKARSRTTISGSAEDRTDRLAPNGDITNRPPHQLVQSIGGGGGGPAPKPKLSGGDAVRKQFGLGDIRHRPRSAPPPLKNSLFLGSAGALAEHIQKTSAQRKPPPHLPRRRDGQTPKIPAPHDAKPARDNAASACPPSANAPSAPLAAPHSATAHNASRQTCAASHHAPTASAPPPHAVVSNGG